MNWSKIKNIMIILLLVVTVFLLLNMVVTRYVSTALPENTGENFVNVLKMHSIEIEKSQIPRYYEQRRTVSAQFYGLDELTKIFLGEKVNYTSDGTNIIAAIGNKKLTVSGTSFEYSSGKVSLETDGDSILRAIKRKGLSSFGAIYVKDEGLVRVQIDSMLVEGVYLDVSLDKNGEIAHAKGVWPNIQASGYEEKVSVISVTDKICSSLPENSTINNLEKIYITESVDNKCVISPGWKVFADGKVYIIG